MLKSGLSSLFTAAKNAATGTDQSVSEDTRKKRMATCFSCPKRIELTNSCGSCGCFLALKTKLAQEKCPEDKWLPVVPGS